MNAFELIEPAMLKDAINAIDPDDPTVRPIAGGTALMLMMKAGKRELLRVYVGRAVRAALASSGANKR